jgi:glutathione S-transferase
LEGKTFIVGEEYSIADMCTLPWVNTFSRWVRGRKVYVNKSLRMKRLIKKETEEPWHYKNIDAYIERCLSRPKTKEGLRVLPIV